MSYATVVVPVVGVSFVLTYPENLHRLADLDGRRVAVGGVEPLPIVLRRNPGNPHDANAVEVHSPNTGMLGHLSREVAARIAPKIDAGVTYATHLHGVRIDPEHPDRPGVDIAISRVEAFV